MMSVLVRARPLPLVHLYGYSNLKGAGGLGMYWLRIPNLFPECFQFLKHTMSHKEEYPADHSPTMTQEESG